ncbi:MAG: hypothetical protein AB1760_00415 [Pseudomonadota bacterium]
MSEIDDFAGKYADGKVTERCPLCRTFFSRQPEEPLDACPDCKAELAKLGYITIREMREWIEERIIVHLREDYALPIKTWVARHRERTVRDRDLFDLLDYLGEREKEADAQRK